jgi:hypothetical protein
MPLSLSEAAKATGTNRTTILRAIKAGKVSATKDVHGNWLIEPVELHRVYPPVQERTGGERNASQYRAQIAEAALSAQIGALRDTADLLRAQLDDMRQDRDHWRTQAEATQRLLADATVNRPWWKRLAG